jgi:hypothetical protein
MGSSPLMLATFNRNLGAAEALWLFEDGGYPRTSS